MKPLKVRSLILAAAMLAMAAFAPAALAAPPANDNFADATELTGALPLTVNAAVDEATPEAGQPGDGYSNGVWFKWTAPASQTIQIDTCSTALLAANWWDVEPFLGVYVPGDVNAPQVNDLQPAALNDDGCRASYLSSVTFRPVAGTTYWIHISMYSNVPGTDIPLRISSVTSSANDDLKDAQQLATGAPQTVDTTPENTTVEQGESDPGNNGTVWFKWTAAETGRISIDTCSTDTETLLFWWLDSRLTVYTVGDDNDPQINELAGITGDDDGCSSSGGMDTRMSKLEFNATAGTTYWIQVANYYFMAEVPFKLRIRAVTSNLESFSEPSIGDGHRPPTAGNTLTGYKGLWESGTSITYGYQWQRCNAAGADCAPIVGATSNTLATSAADVGHTFVFEVTAVDGVTQQTLASRPSLVMLEAPANDLFADASDLGSSLPTGVDGYTWLADVETGEPTAAGPATWKTVWYRWTAPSSGETTLDTCGTPQGRMGPIGGTLGVYSGGGLETLTTVAAASSGCGTPATGSRLTFDAAAGTSYLIQVGASTMPPFSESGFRLSISRPAAPPVDPLPNPAAIDPFPAVKLARSLGTVKPSRKRVAALKRLKLTCGAGATGACTGKLTIKTKKAKSGRRTVKSVSQTFKITIKPGATLSPKLKLSKKLIAALKRAKQLKATVTIKVSAPGFPIKTLKTTVKLKR